MTHIAGFASPELSHEVCALIDRATGHIAVEQAVEHGGCSLSYSSASPIAHGGKRVTCTVSVQVRIDVEDM